MSRSVITTIDVRCSRAHAFDTFTKRLDLWWPRGHRRFEKSTIEIEAEVGGLFVERSLDGDVVEHGVVLVWDPPDRLVYSWNPGSIDKPTEVEVMFETSGEVTVVTVTHSEAEAALGDKWEQRSNLFRKAWSHLMPAFESVCVGDSAGTEEA